MMSNVTKWSVFQNLVTYIVVNAENKKLAVHMYQEYMYLIFNITEIIYY